MKSRWNLHIQKSYIWIPVAVGSRCGAGLLHPYLACAEAPEWLLWDTEFWINLSWSHAAGLVLCSHPLGPYVLYTSVSTEIANAVVYSTTCRERQRKILVIKHSVVSCFRALTVLSVLGGTTMHLKWEPQRSLSWCHISIIARENWSLHSCIPVTFCMICNLHWPS